MMLAKHFSHHTDELQGALIVHAIIYAIGVLARGEDVFFAQDAQVLGDVALRCAHLVHQVLHTEFALAQRTENFKPY